MTSDKWQITIEASEMINLDYVPNMKEWVKNELIDALDGCHLEMKKIKVKRLEGEK